jgi:hypothetical protein
MPTNSTHVLHITGGDCVWEAIEVTKRDAAPLERWGHSVVQLSKTRLLLFGGFHSTKRRLNDVWIFDLVLLKWFPAYTPGVLNDEEEALDAEDEEGGVDLRVGRLTEERGERRLRRDNHAVARRVRAAAIGAQRAARPRVDNRGDAACTRGRKRHNFDRSHGLFCSHLDVCVCDRYSCSCSFHAAAQLRYYRSDAGRGKRRELGAGARASLRAGACHSRTGRDKQLFQGKTLRRNFERRQRRVAPAPRGSR